MAGCGAFEYPGGEPALPPGGDDGTASEMVTTCPGAVTTVPGCTDEGLLYSGPIGVAWPYVRGGGSVVSNGGMVVVLGLFTDGMVGVTPTKVTVTVA